MWFLVEYVIFAVVMVGNLVLGLYFAFPKSRDISAEEIFLGSRTLKTIPLAFSTFASIISSTSIVAFVGHFYAYGFHFAWCGVAVLLVLPVSNFVIIPVLYRLKVTSIFEYITMRYGKYTSLTACGIYFFLMQSNGAVAIFAASVAVSTIFQIPVLWCALTMGFIGTFYTALGGLRGVVWTDCMQAALSILAPVTIIIKVIYDAKRKLVVLEPLETLDLRTYFLNISVDFTKDENLWACLVGFLGCQIYLMGLEQMTVQRYAAARSLKDAKRMAVTAALLTSAFHILRAFTALALIYWYRNCDPLMTGDINTVDQILPFYVSTRLTEFPGFCGIFLAGVVSASTSTVSSIINSCAAVCYVDIISPRFTMTDHRAAQATRAIAFTIGIIMTSYSAVVGYLGTATKVVLAIYSATTGPFCGLLLLAFLFPCANSKGAGTATLLMVTFQIWHISQKMFYGALPSRMPVTIDYCPGNITGVSRNVNESLLIQDHVSSSGFFLSQMSTYWSNLISLILTVIIGLAISLLTGGRQTYKQNIHLSSDIFLVLWRKLGFISSDADTPMNQSTFNNILEEKLYKFQSLDHLSQEDESKI